MSEKDEIDAWVTPLALFLCMHETSNIHLWIIHSVETRSLCTRKYLTFAQV